MFSVSTIKYEACFRRSSLPEQPVACSRRHRRRHMWFWECCDVRLPVYKKQNDFGRAEQSGAAVPCMVVIVTGDENSCCLLLDGHLEQSY